MIAAKGEVVTAGYSDGMLRRSPTDGVDCRSNGEHTVSTVWLRVRVARFHEVASAVHLARDAEARHWLGWGPEHVETAEAGGGGDQLALRSSLLSFVGVQPATDRVLVSVGLSPLPDAGYEVGGMVDPEYRGRGYGREALEAVCLLAHRHFGIVRLRAGCEATNTASQRWLVSGGFVRADGPAHHVLPDGRVIDSLWWTRTDFSARRCRNAPRR
jgi:RimJ/RimL family protein N-acetyltransferase